MHDHEHVQPLELAHRDEHERLRDGAQQRHGHGQPGPAGGRDYRVAVAEEKRRPHDAHEPHEGQARAREAGHVDALVQDAGALRSHGVSDGEFGSKGSENARRRRSGWGS